MESVAEEILSIVRAISGREETGKREGMEEEKEERWRNVLSEYGSGDLWRHWSLHVRYLEYQYVI